MEQPLPTTLHGVDGELARLARFRRLYEPQTVHVFKPRDDKRADALLDHRLALTGR